MHSKTVKFITPLHHTTQGRTTQYKQAKYRNQIYQIISQPKLDKFQLQCYSIFSKWRPKFDHRRWNPCLHESVVCYHATRRTPERSLWRVHVRFPSN